jgi:hypothetical protein
MTEKDHRITDIVNRLDSLTLEANALTRELKELRDTNITSTTAAHPRIPVNTDQGSETEPRHRGGRSDVNKLNYFEIGDKVYITNNYRRRQGTQGTVVHVTTNQVTLRDENGKSHTRKYTNVKRLGL